jgi:hypothetical protein
MPVAATEEEAALRREAAHFDSSEERRCGIMRHLRWSTTRPEGDLGDGERIGAEGDWSGGG